MRKPTNVKDMEKQKIKRRKIMIDLTEMSLRCKWCWMAFTRLYLLKSHLKTHKKVTALYKCVTCAKSFPTKVKLERHKKTHLNEDGTHHRKKQCKVPTQTVGMKTPSKDFYYVTDINCQLKEAYVFLDRTEVPVNNNLVLSDSTETKVNISSGNTIEKNGLKAFVCDTCGRSYGYFKNLHAHQKMAGHLKSETTGMTPTLLTPCQEGRKRESIRRPQNLILHEKLDTKRNTPVSEKDIKMPNENCENNSIAVHTPVKKNVSPKNLASGQKPVQTADTLPYSCNKCEKSYKILSSLTRHRKLLHPHEKSYDIQSTLTRHAKYAEKLEIRKSPNENPENNPTATRTSMQRNVSPENLVSGRNPVKTADKLSYSCNKCEKSYKILSSLTRHRELLHPVAREKSYDLPGSLTRHAKLYHPSSESKTDIESMALSGLDKQEESTGVLEDFENPAFPVSSDLLGYLSDDTDTCDDFDAPTHDSDDSNSSLHMNISQNQEYNGFGNLIQPFLCSLGATVSPDDMGTTPDVVTKEEDPCDNIASLEEHTREEKCKEETSVDLNLATELDVEMDCDIITVVKKQTRKRTPEKETEVDVKSKLMESDYDDSTMKVEKPDCKMQCDQKFKTVENKSVPSKTTVGVKKAVKESCKCVKCGKAFQYRAILLRHMKLSHGMKKRGTPKSDNTSSPKKERKPKKSDTNGRKICKIPKQKNSQKVKQTYTCNICGMSYRYKCILKKHVQCHLKNYYKCDACWVKFKTEEKLSEHQMKFLGKELFPCFICSKQLHSAAGLEVHTKQHLGGRKTICSACNKEFSTARRMQEHKVKKHKNLEYTCVICKERVKYADFKTHRKSHVGEKRFTCNICGKGYQKEELFQKHLYIHEHPYKCKVCGKEYLIKSLYEYHLVEHDEILPYICQYCGKSFKNKHGLNHHVNIHTRAVLFKCKTCGRDFTCKSSLTVHMRSHTKEKPYKCEFCGVGFTQTGQLRLHRYKHTGEKPYKCNLCPKAFTRDLTLKRHINWHMGVKNHHCDICGASFGHSGHLLRHKRVHTGEKLAQHKCSECGKALTSLYSLRRHARKYHNIEIKLQVN